MATDSYDLLELCDAAAVTPRTVRYYVQQGLLPSPVTRGRGSRYDRSHLDRIRLIKRLQGRHLPLAEIRAQLAELSDAAVSALVADSVAGEKSESALAYVRNVLSGTKTQPQRESPRRRVASPYDVPVPPAELPIPKFQARETAAPSSPSSPTEPPLAPPLIVASLAGASAPSAAPPEHSTQSRSMWDRVPLTADIELHIRRPLSRVQNKLLDRLLEHARALFSDHS